MNFLMNPERVL